MPKLIFVIGATAAGKTYFIEQHYGQGDVDILNVYDYQQRCYDEEGVGENRMMSFQTEFRCLRQANELLLDDILAGLAKGRDLVVEHTLYKAKRRIAYLDEIRKLPDVTVEMYVICPSDAQWESNIRERELEGKLEHYKAIAAEIEFPNVAEGIDKIYEVVDYEIRLRMDAPRPEILEPAREELRKENEKLRLEDEERQRRKELLKSMEQRPFWHYCEVCGKKKLLTAQEAFDEGWDYPPKIGHFGLLSPRTCGNCLMKDTLYWKINTSGRLPIVCEGDLTPEELTTWHRIKGEPESLLESLEEGV